METGRPAFIAAEIVEVRVHLSYKTEHIAEWLVQNRKYFNELKNFEWLLAAQKAIHKRCVSI